MAQRRTDPVAHDCVYCMRQLVPHRGEGGAAFNLRRFCNRRCAHWFYWNDNHPNPDDPRLTDPGQVEMSEAVPFPGARAQTLADAPATCVCGGLWFVEDGGLACHLCGRRLYVVTLLREVVDHRGFGALSETVRRQPATMSSARMSATYGADDE